MATTEQLTTLIVAGCILIFGGLMLFSIVRRLTGRASYLDQEWTDSSKAPPADWAESLGVPPVPEGGWDNSKYGVWRDTFRIHSAILSQVSKEIREELDAEEILEKKVEARLTNLEPLQQVA